MSNFRLTCQPEVVRSRVISIFCWIVGFILLVYLAGFSHYRSVVYFLYLKFQSDVSWLDSIIFTAITWGCFYLLFQ